MNATTSLPQEKFSEEETQEMGYMITSTKGYFDEKVSNPRLFIIALWEADRLSIEGSSEKIRNFSKKVYDKLQWFYNLTQK